jgi:hypothetical protein
VFKARSFFCPITLQHKGLYKPTIKEEKIKTMSDRTKLGLGILEAALLLGILGDELLRATPWGFNLTLWVGTLVTSIVILTKVKSTSFSKETYWLFSLVFLFSIAISWRDSVTLKMLDVLIIVLFLSFLSLRQWQPLKIQVAGFMDYSKGLINTIGSLVFGPFLTPFSDIGWKEIPVGKWKRHLISISRGLIIGLPLLFIFGGLLMAADAVFENAIKNIFSINLDNLLLHFLFITVFSSLAIGLLRSTLLDEPLVLNWMLTDTGSVPKDRISFGITEIATALGMVNLLFLSFVVIQIRYFFGGASIVQLTAGLTYAQYARHGFFELVTVAGLVLPLLLLSHWLLNKDNSLHERIFRFLAGFQVLMLFVIMASAMQRMRIYQIEYGMTELRFYTMAFMIWLAFVFIWFIATVLRGRRERFMFGALIAGLIMVAMLHVINPDKLIVNNNAAQIRDRQGFDVSYVTSLSADAVPSLIAVLPTMNQHNQCTVASRILERWSNSEMEDWRSWSWARANAKKAIKENEDILRQIASPQCIKERTSFD